MLPHFFSSHSQEPRPCQGSSTFPTGTRSSTGLGHCGSRIVAVLVAGALLLAGCAGARPAPGADASRPAEAASASPAGRSPATQARQPAATAESVDPSLINPRVTDFDFYPPPRLLGLDAIAPIYNPEFVAASEAPLEPDELVIGIELEGQAKAYPISVLRFREMVNDELAGWPILVSW